jgi:hypothetical protein
MSKTRGAYAKNKRERKVVEMHQHLGPNSKPCGVSHPVTATHDTERTRLRHNACDGKHHQQVKGGGKCPKGAHCQACGG